MDKTDERVGRLEAQSLNALDQPRLEGMWLRRLYQALQYLDGNFTIRLGDAAGSKTLSVVSSAGTEVFRLESDGTVTMSSALGSFFVADAAGITMKPSLVVSDSGNTAVLATSSAGNILRQPLVVEDASDAIQLQVTDGGFITVEGSAGLYPLVCTPDRLIALENSWGYFSYPQFPAAAYNHTPRGEVICTGLVAGGGTGAPTTIFTLPAGSRPNFSYLLPVISNSAFGRMDVGANGAVQFVTGSNTWWSADGVRCMASQEYWTAPTLGSSWVDYGGGYNPAGYMMNLWGEGRVRGLLKSGSAYPNVIFTLPSGSRPTAAEDFLTVADGPAAARIHIDASGNIYFLNSSTVFTSLDTVYFDTNGVGWTDATLVNSWVNYGAPYHNVQYKRDQNGVVRLRGVAKSGPTSQTTAFTLPAGYWPRHYLHFPTTSGDAFAQVRVDNSNGSVQVTCANSNYCTFSGIAWTIW